MDKIREYACELVMRSGKCVLESGTERLIEDAAKWEAYLRGEVPGAATSEAPNAGAESDVLYELEVDLEEQVEFWAGIAETLVPDNGGEPAVDEEKLDQEYASFIRPGAPKDDI